MKGLAVAGVLCCAGIVSLLGVAIVGALGSTAVAAASPVCVTSGPVSGLSPVAAANARTVVAVAESRGGSAAAVIAVMVGYTESGLRILGNTTVAGSTSGPVQGVGSNLDSVGIFQQRASWGTLAQRLDPQQSTLLFTDRLLDESGWQASVPWVAAQRVQESAWDGTPDSANGRSSVVGGNYEPNYPLAQRVVAEVDADPAATDCGALSGGLPANTMPGSHGLPAGYAIPADATPAEVRVVAFALAQLDKPYVFGAAGPAAFDCSGLTMAAWHQGGVSLPHSAAKQAMAGTPTTAAALVPGDLVLVPGDDGTLAAPGHVGLFIGDGLVLNAADQQIGIRVQTYANFVQVGHGLAALRHLP